MNHINQLVIDEIELAITRYLKSFEKATVDDIYFNVCQTAPYFLLKEVLFGMFKDYKLRRRVSKKAPTEYRLTEDFPEFGRPYLPRKPRPQDKALPKEIKKLSSVDACRLNSKVYQLDQLLKQARGQI